MVKPHNKRKKQPKKRTPVAKRQKRTPANRGPRSNKGQVATGERAPTEKARVAPGIARFQWDAPADQAAEPSPAAPNTSATAPRIARGPTAGTAPRVARAPATGTAPRVGRAPATKSPAAKSPATKSPPADPIAAAVAFIEHMPRLPGDLDTMEGFLPGNDTPQLMSAAAMAHLRGTLPPELDPALHQDDDNSAQADPVVAKKSRMSGQLAGLAFLIAGIGFAGWIGQSVARDAEATHWKAVNGEVTLCKSELVSRDPDRYEQLFAYRYKVGSTFLTGRRVRFAGGQGDPVRAHRVGEKIKVFVDPKDAKVSVLEPGVIGWAWAQLIAGLVVAALGGLYLMLGGRER